MNMQVDFHECVFCEKQTLHLLTVKFGVQKISCSECGAFDVVEAPREPQEVA